MNFAELVARRLRDAQQMLVLAESCTAGLVAAQLATVPGISQHLCGSWVTYQEHAKETWLGIDPSLLEKHTAVSPEVTQAMAQAALQRTSAAHLAAAITGHLGPGAPDELDGVCFVAIARRLGQQPEAPQEKESSTAEVELFHGRYRLKASTRVERQHEAAQTLLRALADALAQTAQT